MGFDSRFLRCPSLGTNVQGLREMRASDSLLFFWKCPLTCNFVGGCTFSLKMLMLWAGGTMLLGGSSVDIDRWDISTPSQRDGVDNVGMQYVTICAGQVRISVSREESGPSGAPRLCPDSEDRDASAAQPTPRMR